MSRDDIDRIVGPADGPDYDEMHAVVDDAMKVVPSGQPTRQAAHEVLQRLRDLGLPIPPRRPDDPFVERPD